jgi:hypothetical protein
MSDVSPAKSVEPPVQRHPHRTGVTLLLPIEKPARN